MAFSVRSVRNGVDYYLHLKKTESRGGERSLYFFQKEVSSEGGKVPQESMPEGYIVTESAITGLPLLKKSA